MLNPWRIAVVAVLMTSALGGCSTNLELGSLYATPGKYYFLRCVDLVPRIAGSQARQKELTELMDRANKDTAGPVVNALVYSADLAQARADEKLLRQTAEEKNCNIEPPKPPEQKPAQ